MLTGLFSAVWILIVAAWLATPLPPVVPAAPGVPGPPGLPFEALRRRCRPTSSRRWLRLRPGPGRREPGVGGVAGVIPRMLKSAMPGFPLLPFLVSVLQVKLKMVPAQTK